MALSTAEITDISRVVAREYDERLDVRGVVGTEGGADHVELLLTVHGCHREPCILMVNVRRADRQVMEHDLKERLRDALKGHLA